MSRPRGRRERQAGKRHRRATVQLSDYYGGAAYGTLKVGRGHKARLWRVIMADPETQRQSWRIEPVSTQADNSPSPLETN